MSIGYHHHQVYVSAFSLHEWYNMSWLSMFTKSRSLFRGKKRNYQRKTRRFRRRKGQRGGCGCTAAVDPIFGSR